MEKVVPSVLRQLRATDIIRMAGLTAASLGQEYSRTGAVQNTQRQGARLSGVIEISLALTGSASAQVEERGAAPKDKAERHQYPVEVELLSPTSWVSECPCSPNRALFCAHAAALLYWWLQRPATFVTATDPPLLPSAKAEVPEQMRRERSGDLLDILTRLGLSDLRAFAREYGIATNGLTKQQLAEAIQEAFQQPEMVRRVAATLKKPQRQLLAALTLAGGAMTDNDLRTLYERFKLGQLNQYQSILAALQGKGMIFHTSWNRSLQQSIGPGRASLDAGWYVPLEVRTALRVTVPVTLFDIESGNEAPKIRQVEPFSLLAELLLVARALDGSISLSVGRETPSQPLLEILQVHIARSPAFLRFAVRLLLLANILQKEESSTPYLRVLPTAAQQLLGPAHAEVIRDLFKLWLTQSSSEELFDLLQEEDLQLRSRTTSLNQPLLCPEELAAENSEARQGLVRLLAQVPLNSWVSFAGFVRFVYRLNPLFLQRRQSLSSSPHWWLECEEGRPLRPLHLSDWSRAEARYLLHLLSGPLYWWGICDTAHSLDGQLLAFRLTPLAGWLLNSRALPPEADEQHAQNLATSLAVIDSQEADPQELLITCSAYARPIIKMVEALAEAAGLRDGRLCYRLTPRRLSDALSQGYCPRPLLKLLHQASTQYDAPLAPLLAWLERWIAGYGQVRLYTGVTLLETTDTLVMRELTATTSLDEQVVQTIHPTLLILKKPGAERLIDDLKQRRQFPLLRGEEEANLFPATSWLVEDGNVGEGARALQQLLYLYWSMVAAMREGLSLGSSGLLSRSALRYVGEHMGSRLRLNQLHTESDTPLLLFIRLLLMRLELLQERQGVLHAAPAEPFFALPLAERVRRCYRLYMENHFWNEMLYLPEISVRPGPSPLEPAHEAVRHARQAVVQCLMHETVGTWQNFSTLIARTKLSTPYLLFPQQYGSHTERYSSDCNPYGWDFRLRQGWLTHREGWHMVEGGFIRAVVAGPLHWLGVVDLDHTESPIMFVLSAAAALITSNISIEEEAPCGRLIVQANFELVALAPVSELLLITLDRFADRISLEHIAQYRLTKASVTRAIQKGLYADEIRQALENASEGEVPQNVRYSLGEWERQARRIEIWRSATLLEVGDIALLDGLFASEETRSLFRRRLAPHLAEVALHLLPAVQQVLWQRNSLSALVQDSTLENDCLTTCEAQWHLHNDGRLQPLYAVLNLYLVAEIVRFSERDESTAWQHITPSSLRQALQQGIALDYIIRFLQQYCQGGIPGSFLIRLKLWGGGYSASIQVERAPLLCLSPQILQDLQNDTEIQQLLGSEIAQPYCLVRVAAQNLESVIALLDERGFTVE
jgi:hypothetical protein